MAKWMLLLLSAIACGEPFSHSISTAHVENFAGASGDGPIGEAGTFAAPEGGFPGSAGIGSATAAPGVSGEGGRSTSPDPMPEGGSNLAGEGGESGAPPVQSAWLCRFADGVCQCYEDPSQFETGWLDRTDCPNSQWCASRDSTACVCWADETSWKNFLTVQGTKEEERCPI